MSTPDMMNYTRWEIGGEPQPAPTAPSSRCQLYPMGDRGGTATQTHATALRIQLYPMGDRGGTATRRHPKRRNRDYTRWEIGGEPQQAGDVDARYRIIPDGRSGGNRNKIRRHIPRIELYPMGDRGGTATLSASSIVSAVLYPMGDRGGTATRRTRSCKRRELYPMGDRGGTATSDGGCRDSTYYTRWEIGGEPQHLLARAVRPKIIPDGRSGGNRNCGAGGAGGACIIPDGRSGGNRNT